MGLRKHKGGGGGGGFGSGSGANMTTLILGAVTIILALIGLGIAVDTIAPLLTGASNATALNWTRYPGGESMLKLFPLIMMIGLIVFGCLLVWLGTKGKQMGVKNTVMMVIVVVVAVILLPIVMSACDTLFNNANTTKFTGLTSFLGLIPLLYTVGLMVISGLLGFKTMKGKGAEVD